MTVYGVSENMPSKVSTKKTPLFQEKLECRKMGMGIYKIMSTMKVTISRILILQVANKKEKHNSRKITFFEFYFNTTPLDREI